MRTMGMNRRQKGNELRTMSCEMNLADSSQIFASH
jgi:hypothetical protein